MLKNELECIFVSLAFYSVREFSVRFAYVTKYRWHIQLVRTTLQFTPKIQQLCRN